MCYYSVPPARSLSPESTITVTPGCLMRLFRPSTLRTGGALPWLEAVRSAHTRRSASPGQCGLLDHSWAWRHLRTLL